MQFSRLVSPTGFYIIDAIQLGDMSVLLDVLRHAVLPALALGLLTAGVFIRLVRTNVIATYNSGYVEAARSAASQKRLLNKHAWKPALIPIITVMGMQIALMLAGAVLTETAASNGRGSRLHAVAVPEHATSWPCRASLS